MPSLDRDGDVFLLDLGDTENRFHPDWLAEAHTHLSAVEATEGPRALVMLARGKFFSNGLDLDWVSSHGELFVSYLGDVHALLARTLTLSAPTVAAVQGHAFAGGAMLALATDFRVMRADRGFFCLPEVDIGLPFSPGMAGLVMGKLSPRAAHEAMTTGRRYGGTDALAAGIVDAVAHEDDVLAAALDIARPLTGKAGATFATIKARMYGATIAALRDTDHPLGDVPG